jgi:hypothetical protein
MRIVSAFTLWLLASSVAGEEAPKTFGSAFLEPVAANPADWKNLASLRYQCRVVENECREDRMWKIVFGFFFLHGPRGAAGYELQCNLYSNRFVYPPNARRKVSGEVAGLRAIAGESGLFLSIPDNLKNRRVGARTRSAEMFPTLDQEIDGIRDLWKREQVAQANLTGKTITVTINRGEMAANRPDWSAHGALPPGEYRLWTISAAWDGQRHDVDFAVPAENAEQLHPARPMQLATEAFAVHPGALKIYFWDVEAQKLGSEVWSPMREWKLVTTDAAAGKNTWGFKAAKFEDKPVIEASNAGTKTYLARGEALKLK